MEDSAESHSVHCVEKPKGAFGFCVCSCVCRGQSLMLGVSLYSPLFWFLTEFGTC